MDGEVTSSNPDLGTSVDQIADLLEGNTTEDLKDEETLSEESTEVEESDEQIDEVTDEQEPTDEEPVEESTEETVDESWESVLGLEEDQLAFDEEGNLSGVTVKIDGKTSTVNMKDLVAGYQVNKAVTQKSQALAEERKAFEGRRNQFEQEYTKKLENAETLTNILGNRLVGEYESVNWDQLRAENPAEYAALKQDYASRANEIQQAQQALAQEKQMKQQKTEQENNARRAQLVAAELDLMISKNPTWADENVRKKDMSNIAEEAIEAYGFKREAFDNIIDHKIVEVLKDALAFRKGKKIATEKLKKPVPKFQKSSGKPSAKKVTKLEKLTKKAQGASGANKRHAQTDAIVELLNGVA